MVARVFVHVDTGAIRGNRNVTVNFEIGKYSNITCCDAGALRMQADLPMTVIN